MVDGEGCKGNSGRFLKWDSGMGGGGRVIKESFQNILNRQWVTAKVVRRGRGYRECHHPCTP